MREKENTVVADTFPMTGSFTEVIGSIKEKVRSGYTVRFLDGGALYGAAGDAESYVKGLEDARTLYSEFMSYKSRRASAKKRVEGVPLGRPDGSDVKMRLLVENADKVRRMLGTGATYNQICRRYGVSPSTLKRFLKRMMEKE